MPYSLKHELGEPKPIDVRHLQVDNQHTTMAGGAQPIEGIESGMTVRGFFDLTAEACAASEQVSHEDAHVGFVIDDQDREVAARIERPFTHRQRTLEPV